MNASARRAALKKKCSDKLTIEGEMITTESPEGVKATMPVSALVERLVGRSADRDRVILPDGVVAVYHQGPYTIWVHQSPPQVRLVNWIKEGSKVKYGPGTEYRLAELPLPYTYVIAVFEPVGNGQVTLSGRNECFFGKAPLSSPKNELFYPALLNCSKFSPPEGHPLSWVCTQYLPRDFDQEPDQNARMRLAMKGLLSCLYETGFNYSSEHHEGSSWFTESRTVDPRLSTVKAWEKAGKEDPLFVLEVPWLSTGMNLEQVVERSFAIHGAGRSAAHTAGSLARIVHNHADSQPPAETPPINPEPEFPF